MNITIPDVERRTYELSIQIREVFVGGVDCTTTPGDPVAPVGPVGPVTPVAPVAPVAPVGPVAPAVPAAPAGPVSPVGPVQPVGPVAPAVPAVPAVPEPPALKIEARSMSIFAPSFLVKIKCLELKLLFFI